MRTTNGQLWGKPANGIDSKYLLVGLVRCGLCGGGLQVTSRSHGQKRVYFYPCTSFHRKGETVCANNRPNQIVAFLQEMAQLREMAGSAA